MGSLCETMVDMRPSEHVPRLSIRGLCIMNQVEMVRNVLGKQNKAKK